MADRAEIAARHGISHLAHKLVGTTAEELEADAAARAAVLQMFRSNPLKQAQHQAIVRSIHGGGEGGDGDV